MTEPTPAELNESAMNHFSRGNGIEAARQLQWALIGNPLYHEAWHNRALVLRALNDPFDAILCVDQAIERNPMVADYHNTRGVCWATMGQLKNAVDSYDDALTLNPELASAWHNKASAAKLTGDLDGAVAYYAKAVEIVPENSNYHLSYSSALLAAGRFAEGWHEYEHRFKVSDAFHRMMPLPEWNGTSECRGLVLYAEQGFGDAIMFARFAPVLKKQLVMPTGRLTDLPVKIYLEVKKPMVELCRTMNGIDGVIAYGDPLPKEATHCLPIMSAARMAGINTIDDVIRTNVVPYFDVKNTWVRTKAKHMSDLRVGICWHAGVRPYQPELKDFAERKSIPAPFLAPLAEIKGVEWVSLQLPSGSLPFHMNGNAIHHCHDFMDTAVLMRSLDLVVSVDTSVIHLAGALGLQSIVMTPFDNCWRWMGDAVISPWYPTLRQYRQHAPGDWPSVIERVVNFVKVRQAMVYDDDR